MKELFMKLKNKKDSGATVEHMFPIILTAIAIAAIAVIFSSWMANLDRKNNLDIIARKYMLVMETEGGLRSDAESDLTDELTAAGLTNITITASKKTDNPTTDPGYGEQIELIISGDMKAYNYKMLDLFSVQTSEGTIPVTIKKVSTAKH